LQMNFTEWLTEKLLTKLEKTVKIITNVNRAPKRYNTP